MQIAVIRSDLKNSGPGFDSRHLHHLYHKAFIRMFCDGGEQAFRQGFGDDHTRQERRPTVQMKIFGYGAKQSSANDAHFESFRLAA